jgi:hypothetical protein
VGEITNQIEQEIRQKRDHLGRNLDELEGKARELADWRTHYRNHSPAFLGAAFGLGVVLGLAAMSRRQPTPDHGDLDTDMSHDPYPARPAARRAERGTGTGTAGKALRQVGETWEQIADALVRTASMKAIELVGEFVPGFRENVRKRDLYDGVTH